jgi:probable selenium-dependent hydroxylase accessory protein YqeC
VSYSFLDPWHGFLPKEGGHILSIMGSGGKTSLLLALGKLYQQWNIPVVLTTTTKSETLSDIPRIAMDDLASKIVLRDDLPQLFFLHNGLDEDRKMAGLAPEMVDNLGAWFPDHVILAEVDGAAKMPLKIHRQGEPVWPHRTSMALVVMNVSAVGDPVGKVVHRFGRETNVALAKLKEWENLEWEQLADLLLGDNGYLEQVPSEVPAVLVMTGMDTQDDSIGLFAFVGQAMDHDRLPIVTFCDFGSENGEIRSACRDVAEVSEPETSGHD